MSPAPGTGPWRPASEKCPGRGDGGAHEVNDVMHCIWCGQAIVLNALEAPVPVVTEVKPMPETPAPAPWRGEATGLIDGLLERRSMPDPKYLEDFLKSHEFKRGFQAGVDASLDVMVPALKKIRLLPPYQGSPGSLPRGEVDEIIGKVPLVRTVSGWE